MNLQTGTVVGRYRLESLLGEGGMDVTWRAVHLDSGEPRALKMVLNRDPAFQERLRRAADAQRRIAHPNLVRVHEVVDVHGAATIVMELVAGGTLERWAAEPRPLGVVLAVFRDIVRGVGAAHAEGLVHRNLKPAKILLGGPASHPAPKVNDFSLVKIADAGKQLTQMGVSFGTPQYMAPEQFRDVSAVDARADLFALGAILYELVVGRRAFDGAGVIDIYKQVVAGGYTPPAEVVPDLPPPVLAAIDRLLAPDPAERPQSTDELLQLLFGDGSLEPLLPSVDAPAAAPASAPGPATAEDDEIGEDPYALDSEPAPRPSMPLGLILAMGGAGLLVILAALWAVLT